MASDQLARLQKRLEAIPEQVKQAVQPALKKSGDELADRMKHLAPKDTGALVASIAVTTAGNTTPPYSQPGGAQIVPDNAVMITAGNSAVRYPHLVEYGTVHAPAQPFFWVSYRLTKSRIKTRLRHAIAKAVREGWGK